MARASDDELEDILALHYAVGRLLSKRFKGTVGNHRRYQVLAYLQTRKAAQPKELAKALRVRESTVTSIVDRLEEDGFVQRDSETDWIDSRNRWIRITEKGLKVLADAVDERYQLSNALLLAVGHGGEGFRERIRRLAVTIDAMN